MCLRKALCESKLKKTFSLFPAVHSSAYMIPGALRGISALGNSISALPGALRGSFAPGKWIIVMSGAQRGHFAPGKWIIVMPGAQRGISAPGKLNIALLGANDYCFAPGGWIVLRQKVFSAELGSVAGRGRVWGRLSRSRIRWQRIRFPLERGSEDGCRAGPSPIGKRER